MNSMLRILCSILVFASLFSCTQQLAGNGSEITNGYCIASASPADSAMVVAYPNDYLPYPQFGRPETTFTDKNGHFALRLGRKGWNLVIYDRLQAFGAFVPLPRGDSAVDTVVLRHCGSISGIVNDTAANSKCIGVVGSPFYGRITGKTDTFSLMKIPAFRYYLSMWRLKVEISDSSGKVISSTSDLYLNNAIASAWVQPDSATNIVIYP